MNLDGSEAKRTLINYRSLQRHPRGIRRGGIGKSQVNVRTTAGLSARANHSRVIRTRGDPLLPVISLLSFVRSRIRFSEHDVISIIHSKPLDPLEQSKHESPRKLDNNLTTSPPTL